MASWIEGFVGSTEGLESPKLFRRWAAIFTLGAVMEMKVWLRTTSELYPNLYLFLVGQPGVGKNRTIRAVKRYMTECNDFNFAPTSLTGAALVDTLSASKRFITRLPEPPLEYNTTCITAEELSAFMHKYDDEMIGLLTAFYDPDPYAQARRGKDLRITIDRPQINLISGTTPSNLLTVMPPTAWDQGFTSRVIMIYSDERRMVDDFIEGPAAFDPALAEDIRTISNLTGEFHVTPSYQEAVNAWREAGEIPKPTHPKLLHYATRRKVHLYKLSMIAAVDRGNALVLDRQDFDKALAWLTEAEAEMGRLFSVAGGNADSQVIDEVLYYMRSIDKGEGVPERMIINFTRTKIRMQAVWPLLETMQAAGLIASKGLDKFGHRWFKLI